MPEDILSRQPPAADLRVSYGSDPNQFADLFLPKSAAHPLPVVMNIHGGYWRAKYELTHASRFCRALADAGFAVWAIEYRRVGNSGGGWPGTFEDILSASNALARAAEDHYQGKGLSTKPLNLSLMNRRIFQRP